MRFLIENDSLELDENKDLEEMLDEALELNENYDTMPSKEHTRYVIHNVIRWERDYSPKDLSDVNEVAEACHKYDDSYSVSDYQGAIEYYDLFDEDGYITDAPSSLDEVKN